ncbi:serine acetyltransferase [Alicyclobacillus contaminans]|uniref:serine O-acetyltransferase EpsC n=1 Tax=Alicyclobacillus contaminans TaxID=392016 RepID=UPI00041202E6|nr:serine O-acetyltransferase EpsC [Alicyclobacillus contaminans]GMA51540.1 serine acetyltransferase [Alicyclobacillus contaminans]
MPNRDLIARKLQEQSRDWFPGRSCHPETSQIERMIEAIRWVLFPNYFKPSETATVSECIDKLHAVLASQIHRAVYQACFEKDSTPDSARFAEEKADEVIQWFPTLQQLMYEDIVATYNGDPAATGYDEIILTYPGLIALMVYRIAHVVHQLDVPLLPRMMTEYAHRLTGIEIHPGATLGRGIMIDHGTGIVIGETAVVGNNVKIYQGVTLGALFFPRDEAGFMVRKTKRHPTVEDNVILYSNATVLGGDTVIGHDSVIGSNAWVTESVPPHSKVIYQTESVVTTKRSR